MAEGDREWQDESADELPGADEVGGEPHDDEWPQDADPDGGSEPRGKDRKPSEGHEWRRLALIALIIVTVGVAWALVLGTIFVARSGDRTAELISLFEAGQQQRQGAFGEAQQGQKERQAALKTQRQQSQLLRAEELAAVASQAKSNAETRQALANEALAGSRANEADADAALAQAQAEAQARRANRPTTAQANAQAALTAAIDALRVAIKKLGKRGPRH